MELFSINSSFFHFMSKVAEQMILSVLWIICSIPLFTLGAASTALYYCIIKVIRQDGAGSVKNFFRIFRENFRNSTTVSLLVLLVLVLVSLIGTVVYRAAPETLTSIYTVYLVLGALLIAWLHYVFSYLARFDAPLKTVLKNSLVICIANLPLSISMVVLFMVAVGGFALYLPASFMCLLLLPGFYCLASSYLLERVYKKYLPKEGTDHA